MHVQENRCIVIQPRLTREQEIVIGNLCYNAGKVWNVVNYHLINGNLKFNVYDIYSKLRNNFFVRNIHSRSAQILMGQLVEGWEKYFDYLKNPENYSSPVRRPGFMDKRRAHHTIIYDKTGFKVLGSKIRLSIQNN
ncbi:hypothetical protein [Archaeoglobus sulfaticallidus]|uniref:hypothetical protein n=1 Tax=Archaeoglobus sulfaticallidus TaxID=1316941 RepID=UPI000694F10F|nr:hypothetical protein [Archaeoglobus sulfaticallidus]